MYQSLLYQMTISRNVPCCEGLVLSVKYKNLSTQAPWSLVFVGVNFRCMELLTYSRLTSDTFQLNARKFCKRPLLRICVPSSIRCRTSDDFNDASVSPRHEEAPITEEDNSPDCLKKLFLFNRDDLISGIKILIEKRVKDEFNGATS
ncbi:hypothetical protein TNCT_558481 [Trichonephila clavata]|uniref:Uncharacterized protein n=1 Tax=Trichonephila clavata TaxID=2740835 RepID=A0A8X6HXZ1_TRICU|nr:hypothetical protein TNCT_558481 [Trichonephila clavata]